MNQLPVRRKTVLVVYDDAGLRGFVTQVLQREGCEVLAAVDSLEAFLICDQCETEIDLLVTDMDGVALAQAAEALWPRLKVLYISDNISGELSLAVAFIRKPFLPDALVTRIRQMLELPQ